MNVRSIVYCYNEAGIDGSLIHTGADVLSTSYTKESVVSRTELRGELKKANRSKTDTITIKNKL